MNQLQTITIQNTIKTVDNTEIEDIFTRELSKITALDLIKTENTGRPLFNGKDVQVVVAKLAYASAIGATVTEACAFAGISRDSYYRCATKYPKFRNRIEQLRFIPILQARVNIVRAIMSGDVKLSMWYLERKLPEEFGR